MRVSRTERAAILLIAAVGLVLAFVPASASCAIVGDSIAVSVGRFIEECLVDAKSGIPSAEVIPRVHPADVLFVSAGSNDPRNPRLEDNLRMIRAKASAAVVWIVPISPTAAVAVERVAATHDDPIVRFEPSSDGVHPKSYSDLAIALRRFLSVGLFKREPDIVGTNASRDRYKGLRTLLRHLARSV
jgi:hypothetical protein